MTGASTGMRSFHFRGVWSGRQKTEKGRQNRLMKFIHIADVHLGAQPDAGPMYSHQRPRELWETFEHVIRVDRKSVV